jgi:hypothetical protein
MLGTLAGSGSGPVTSASILTPMPSPDCYSILATAISLGGKPTAVVLRCYRERRYRSWVMRSVTSLSYCRPLGYRLKAQSVTGSEYEILAFNRTSNTVSIRLSAKLQAESRGHSHEGIWLRVKYVSGHYFLHICYVSWE